MTIALDVAGRLGCACFLALAAGACNGASPTPASTDRHGGLEDAGCEWACPAGDDGGVCTCEGNTAAACPASASESAPCSDSGDGCMGCYQGAGFYCTCGADGGGAQWSCVGTEHACTGGTF